MFNLDTWKQEVGDSLRHVGAWLEQRSRQNAPLLLYGYLSSLALLPVALAAQKGDLMPAALAMGSVVGGVGGNLIAARVQEWAGQSQPVTPQAVTRWVTAQTATNPDIREALDTILQEMQVIEQAQANLPQNQQQFFLESLRAELQQLGNLPRFEATLREGAIAQGEGARAAYAKDKGVAIAGDVHGNITVNHGPTTPDPADLRAAYLNRLLERCSALSLTGIDPKAASNQFEARLELSAVYTALLTTAAQHERLRAGREAEPEKPRYLSALEQLDQHPRLVLLGDPGSGKSTFVDFVTMCLAGHLLGHPTANLDLLTAPLPDNEGQDQTERQPWRHQTLLPLPIILRDFAARGLPAAGVSATAKHLWRFIAAELKAGALGAFARPLAEELHRRGGLLLLDGLDEVPEADQRRVQIKQAVADFGRTFNRCRILVTSRTYAYQQQDWRLPGFEETVLAPFSQGQIRRFVTHWYRHLAGLRGLNPDDAQGRAELLQRAIFGSDRLRSLAERPLLLTLMASLHAWRGGSLPEKREELYADTVDLLLDWWESPKVVRGQQGQAEVRQRSLAEWLKIDRAKVRQQLNHLAFAAHTEQPELTGTADVTEANLVTGLLQVSQNPDIKPVRLVEYLRDRAGLLLPRGVGVYTFPHRTFQEYLAACHLTDTDYPDRVGNLARRDPNRWREVALLAGAKAARGTSAAIWQLVDALCYRDPGPAATMNDCWGALLAGQALVETANLQHVSERNQPKLERVRRWLVAIIEGDDLPATERALAGRNLAWLGDDRPGVGLLPTGLPDIVWCEVPAGPFLYGDDKERRELPAFKISQYPITNAQYQAFVADGGYSAKWQHCWTEAGWEDKGDRTEPYRYGGDFDLPNHPVVGVTWYEAVAFSHWLNERVAKGEFTNERMTVEQQQGWAAIQAEIQNQKSKITLPTEPEWEKAARGTAGREYPWGNNDDPNKANCDETQIGTPSAVGCFPQGKSVYGCGDMAGNVWEWCRTKYDQPDDHTLEGGNDIWRVLRGGAYYSDRTGVLCARRLGDFPYDGDSPLGFRVVVSPFFDKQPLDSDASGL
jgi:formylglycine-generating enzyme required for sulfatase activity